MKKDHDWPRLTIIYLGLFGAALAIAGMMIALPAQAIGTCGPGSGSESAAIAFFDPITIGAQPEPPASNPAGRAEWRTFVHGCQSAADTRMFITLPLLAVSVGLVILGVVLILRRNRRRNTSGSGRWTSGRAMTASGSGGSHPDPAYAPSFGETHAALARPATGTATALATRPKTTEPESEEATDPSADGTEIPDSEPSSAESEITPIELGPASIGPEAAPIELGPTSDQPGG